jgi:signal transduction histidine kinase
MVQALPGPLPAALETDLLRVAQEALSNAVRHARAREVAVELSCEGGWLALRVTDDGCGFDVDSAATNPGAGFGLRGMRTRAAARGGRLEVLSRPGRGTEVVLRLPLRQERARAGLWGRALGGWGRGAS